MAALISLGLNLTHSADLTHSAEYRYRNSACQVFSEMCVPLYGTNNGTAGWPQPGRRFEAISGKESPCLAGLFAQLRRCRSSCIELLCACRSALPLTKHPAPYGKIIFGKRLRVLPAQTTDHRTTLPRPYAHRHKSVRWRRVQGLVRTSDARPMEGPPTPLQSSHLRIASADPAS